jgi:hypothetical protein
MSNKRIFISFAVEDANLRDLLVGQAKNANSPFEFVDMSVKEPWDTAWKTKCRTKIKGCDGMLVIVTSNTLRATGQLWEVNCAKEEKIPLLGIWGHKNRRLSILPDELKDVKIVDWTWDNIARWLNTL